jgi:hypothetical protein
MKLTHTLPVLALGVAMLALSAAPAAATIHSGTDGGTATLNASNVSFTVGSFSITCAVSTLTGSVPKGGTSSISMSAPSNVVFRGAKVGDPCTSSAGPTVTIGTFGTWDFTSGKSLGGGQFEVSLHIGGMTATVNTSVGFINVPTQTITCVWTNATHSMTCTTLVTFTANGAIATIVGASGNATFSDNDVLLA